MSAADPDQNHRRVNADAHSDIGSSTDPTDRRSTADAAGGSGTRLADQRRLGLVYGLSAFLLWGLIPFFFVALAPSGPWEILAHRIVWTFALCFSVLAIRRDLRWVRPTLRRRRLVAGLAVAAVVIALNWVVYVNAVLGGQTSEAALGYFLNPLVTVALGVLVLGERLRPLQWLAVAIAGVAAVFLTIVAGQVPITALALAFSFALYGLIKNRVGANLAALHGLTVETAVLTPFAVIGLVLIGASGTATFASAGGGHVLLMMFSGVVTAAPLTLFAAAARRIPLVTIGLLQFIAPIMQLLAALALGEYISPARWVGFAIVWVALIVLTVDSLHTRLRR